MHARTGYDQITDAGQSVEGLLFSAHYDTQTGNLRNSAGDQRRLRVIAASQPIRCTGCQRNDIFKSRANFHAQHIRAGVNTEHRAHKHTLHELGSLFAVRRCHTGGRQSPAHLLGMARSGKDGYLRQRKFLLDDL